MPNLNNILVNLELSKKTAGAITPVVVETLTKNEAYFLFQIVKYIDLKENMISNL